MFQIKLYINHFFNKIITKNKVEKTLKMTGKQSTSYSILSFVIRWSIIVIFGAFILFPFYYMISFSLMSLEEVRDIENVHLIPKKNIWENFEIAFQEGYWEAVWLTFLTTALSVVIKILITMLVGYAFSLPNWRGKTFAWYFFLSLLTLPELALFFGQYKIIIDVGLDKGLYVILALVAPYVASVFSGIMFRNAFLQIPSRTKEAAFLDGCSEWKYFWKIAVKMISPTIWTVGILTAFAAWNSFLWPSLLLKGTGRSVISLWVFETGVPKDDVGAGRILENVRMAGTVIAILPMFIVYFAMRTRIMKAISKQGSAIKG